MLAGMCLFCRNSPPVCRLASADFCDGLLPPVAQGNGKQAVREGDDFAARVEHDAALKCLRLGVLQVAQALESGTVDAGAGFDLDAGQPAHPVFQYEIDFDIGLRSVMP